MKFKTKGRRGNDIIFSFKDIYGREDVMSKETSFAYILDEGRPLCIDCNDNAHAITIDCID